MWGAPHDSVRLRLLRLSFPMFVQANTRKELAAHQRGEVYGQDRGI